MAGLIGVFGWIVGLVSICFFSAVAAGAAMEPRQSVWVMSCFGSAGAALYGPRRHPVLILLHWAIGVGFAVAFVEVVDHVQPEAEALLVGLTSGVATKSWIDGFGSWVGAMLVRQTTGKP